MPYLHPLLLLVASTGGCLALLPTAPLERMLRRSAPRSTCPCATEDGPTRDAAKSSTGAGAAGLTVIELRAELRERGLRVSGRKCELQDRLTRFEKEKAEQHGQPARNSTEKSQGSCQSVHSVHKI